MIDNAVVVFSGYNTRAVIAFCRWARSNNIIFYIIAKDHSDPVLLTDYRSNVFLIREKTQLDHVEINHWIKEIISKNKHEKLLILPSTEYLNRFLLENRNRIENASCTIPLTNKKTYTEISDKYSFASICSKYSLKVPEEYKDKPKSPPFVAKPRSYSSRNGEQLIPKLIRTTKELEEFNQNELDSDYFFQDLVSGNSLYLLAYIGEKETILFSQENLIQQAKGGSIILAKRSNFHESKTAHEYVKMLHKIGFSGLIMIETFSSERGDFMIEANPRLWGPIQLAIDNDIDLFGPLLRDYGFIIKKNNIKKNNDGLFYFWSGGFTTKAKPFSYHSYSNDEFIKELSDIKQHDIFQRDDSNNIFLKESKISNYRD